MQTTMARKLAQTSITSLVVSGVLLSDLAAAAATTSSKKPKAYPFNQLVVFGDQFSDDGNGSFAHGLDPGNIYGYHTWTDGPVVPQYLASLLGVPSVNYAWGGADGGGLAGSTIDNDYTPAKDTYNGKPVPSTQEQIFDNYTLNGAPANIAKDLSFIWIGQNDLKKHTNWYADPPSLITPDAKINVAFYNNFTTRTLAQVEHLIQLGAPGVVVINLYPIQTAPITTIFLCKAPLGSECAQNWGKVIETANSKLQAALAASQFASKIIYYDVYSYLMKVMQHKNKYGFTESLAYNCDGNHSLPTNKWDECIVPPKWTNARPFFWFTNDQPETNAHQLIARDVKKAIDAHFRQ